MRKYKNIHESIVDTLNEYEFVNAMIRYLNNSERKGQFTTDGLYVLYDLILNLNDGEDVEFEPLTFCIEFTEYDDPDTAYEELCDEGDIDDYDLILDDDEKFEAIGNVIDMPYLIDRGCMIVCTN